VTRFGNRHLRGDEAVREQQDGRGALLRIPAVRRLVLAYLGSSLGSAILAVAIAFAAYQRSRSMVLTVIVLSANALPAFFLSPLVGRLATRRDPRSVYVLGQAAKIVQSGAMAALAFTGDLSYGLLIVSGLLNGSISALIGPSWPQLMRMVAPEDRLPELTAFFPAISAAASIVGALVGGVVVATLGIGWAFTLNALSFLPMIVAVGAIAGDPPKHDTGRHAIRAGFQTVSRNVALRRAFVLAGLLNLAAWPVLSTLPALAHEIEPRGHILGFLTGAFYAGAAAVTWVVARMRRRYPYSRILFVGFLTAGLMLLAHAVLTGWRNPGSDAVVAAALTLVPIGLAVSLNTALLQALVQLDSPRDDERAVLVVYATVTTIVTPLGGLLIGVAADAASLWWALAGCGLVLTVLALSLRNRLVVFDPLDQQAATAPLALSGHHLALAHLSGAEVFHHAFAQLHDRDHSARPSAQQ
jgi:MFS family permease